MAQLSFVHASPALPPAARVACGRVASRLCAGPPARLEISADRRAAVAPRRRFALGSAWSFCHSAGDVLLQLEGARAASVRRSVHAAGSAASHASSSVPRAEAAAGAAGKGFGEAPKPKPDAKEAKAQQPAKPKGPPARIPAQPWIIAGLGNPGKEYEKTRHNAGFLAIDVLAAREGLKFDKQANSGFIARGTVAGVPVTLVKPQTYMNASGQCVVPIAKYYQIPPERILVLYDDMDTDIGAIRIRSKGSAGGQNGLKSIIAMLGGVQTVPRIRIGIGRPPGKLPPKSYVLQRAAAGEEAVMEGAYERAADAVRAAVMFGVDYAMNQYNGKP
eukprot:tig00021244_g19574.t1